MVDSFVHRQLIFGVDIMSMTREEYDRLSGAGGTKVHEATGLAPDYMNAWMKVGQSIIILEDRKGDNPELYNLLVNLIFSPVQTYEEYLHENLSEDWVPFILEDSSIEAVQKIDAHVHKYNSEIATLKQNVDLARAQEFFNRADILVRSEELLR